MVEGPEVNPLLAAYEAMSSSIDTRIDRRHHEATVGAQTALFENVKVMTTVLQDMGNPFQNESSDLLSLDTKNIANPSLAHMRLFGCEMPEFRFQPIALDTNSGTRFCVLV